MPPKMGSHSKKRKLTLPEQTLVQKAISQLAALDLTFTSVPPAHHTGLIAPLKPGLGLLGTAEEEEAYYAQYEKDLQDDEVGALRSKDTTLINIIKEQQRNDGGISSADSDDAQADNPYDDDDDDDDDEQLKQIQTVSQHEDIETLPEDDPDEEIDLSEVDRLHFGRDFINVDGEYIHATVYFGPQWIQRIFDLDAVPAMEHPENMTIVLYDHQLKGAAQMDFLAKSSFKGGILADGMGVGKTHTSIAMMHLVKDEPGFCVVVAPKTLCLQWVDAIESAWEEGHGMRAYLLEGSSITAHELLALGVDVVVCSYDQVHASGRARKALLNELDAYNNDQTGLVKKPTRPNAVLHSSFWREMNLPIKRLILDEAQVVNKRCEGKQGVRHGAIKDLYYRSVTILSGTPAHNKWHNISGLADFLQGHPFTTHTLFMKAFASLNHEGNIDRPDLPRIRLLQRFLQAFMIARPSDILKLKECTRHRAYFKTRAAHRKIINGLVRHYLRLIAVDNSKNASFEVETNAKEALSYAIRAQLMSLSPFLLEKSVQPNPDEFVDIDEDDPIYGYVSADKATKAGETRDKWLQEVRAREELIEESDRVRQFLLVYKQLRKTNPHQKILVFSQYLKFLDILEEALKRAFDVQALRFDGKVSQSQRLKVQQHFKEASAEVPLLITAGSGACGLNITDASIIIQCEIWWNLSVKWQSICRVWRQRQENEVLAILLFSRDSAIDLEISKVQVTKADITSELMEAIVRRPGEEPDIRDLCFPRVIAS